MGSSFFSASALASANSSRASKTAALSVYTSVPVNASGAVIPDTTPLMMEHAHLAGSVRTNQIIMKREEQTAHENRQITVPFFGPPTRSRTRGVKMSITIQEAFKIIIPCCAMFWSSTELSLNPDPP